jgi:hypothetical protein
MRDWLVDHVDDAGQPVARKKSRRGRRTAGISGITKTQLEEVTSIFGPEVSEFLPGEVTSPISEIRTKVT